MPKKKTLHELGEEYESEAVQIKKRIAVKRSELRSLSNSVCSNEAFEIKRELKNLYGQYRDTIEIAEYLKSYYEPHEGRRELFSYK
ncbi:MAG: hypothetical protein IJE72_01075 [Clostridia bacterium]|nr:hypothetical protein [Clostridia bacterium]